MAWHRRLDARLVVEVRRAPGTVRELGERFGLPATTVWRIKHGLTGASVPYTHTVMPPGERRPGRGVKLDAGQIARIKGHSRRDREASEELAAECGVTASRVREIWRETDFMAAHRAAASEPDAEVVAGRVRQI